MAVAPHGAWESPITATAVTAAALRFSDSLEVDGGDLYWTESRPAEGGRTVVVQRRASGEVSDVTPAGFDARTRVHEYGGGAYAVRREEVYFANFADQRLYRHRPGEDPRPITPEPVLPAGLRYADFTFGDGFLICTGERHGVGEVWNELIRLPLDGSSTPEVIAAGHDFYSSPRFSPDGAPPGLAGLGPPRHALGRHRAVGRRASARRHGSASRAGGRAAAANRSSSRSGRPGGVLHFVSDRSGWWNLYRLRGRRGPAAGRDGGGFGRAAVGLRPVHLRLPRPTAGSCCLYATAAGSWPAGPRHQRHVTRDRCPLGHLDRRDRWPRPAAAACSPAHSTACPAVGLLLDLTSGPREVIRAASMPDDRPRLRLRRPSRSSSRPPDGPAHAFFYPPANPDFAAPADELPPLLVDEPRRAHRRRHAGARPARSSSGPAAASPCVDVNYGGSTGYGRAYRERLRGHLGRGRRRRLRPWRAATWPSAGEVDPARLAIRGGSAGGYTTLCALDLPRRLRRRAPATTASADLEALARDTHKFESRYLDRLIGPYPQARDLYRERSPIHHLDGHRRAR